MNIIVTLECGWCREQRRAGESAVAIFAAWPTRGMLDDFCRRQMRDHHADHPGGMSVRFSVEGRPEYRPGLDDDDDEDAQPREALRHTETLERGGSGIAPRR